MNTAATRPTSLAQRLAMLHDIDDATYTALRAVLPVIAENGATDDDMAALVDLLCQTCAEEPVGTLALVARLDALVPQPISVTMLRRWAFDGLQRYCAAPAIRLQYFKTGNPLSFADLSAQTDAGHVLARRSALQHYLAGFGFSNIRVELHAPQLGLATPTRVTIGDDLLLVPRHWSETWADGVDTRDRLYRAAMAHVAAHLKYSPHQRPAGNRHPMLLAMLALIEDARVERLMLRQYPGLQSLWGDFHVATRLSVGFDLTGLAARLARALHEPAYADNNAWVLLGRQMFEEAATDLHNIAAFDRIGRQLAIKCTKMRLAFDAERYRVVPAYRDDNMLLWNHNAALSDDARGPMVYDERFKFHEPQKEPLHPLLTVETDLHRRWQYPEWDCKLATLHENWSTVIEVAAPCQQIPALRHVALHRPHSPLRFNGLARIPDRSLRLKRLYEGDELDLDAVVDCIVQRAGGLAPDPRIFMRHSRRRRSTAIVLLMDLSESTKRFVSGSFTSVLDIEKRAATLVAESLDASRDRVAVHGFSSNGRHEVHYVRIKDFDDPFGPEQKARLKDEKGRLSTRMGAALRHASETLVPETSERKLILLLTDGEPSDVDVFEDDYLVEDARHAVTSATARGIDIFCLTLDRQADGYVQRIFGARNYLIADQAATFANSTGQALVKLIAQ
ncbi:MAG: VWA domain-containing protein [Burkholderiales bacterium]